jgi:hypothetical protein
LRRSGRGERFREGGEEAKGKVLEVWKDEMGREGK